MMLPPDFQTRLAQQLGQAEADALCRAVAEEPSPVSVRLNPLKPAAALPAEVEGCVPWCAEGRYLAARPKFTYDPLFHAGAYYVQEAASMFIEQAFRRIRRDFAPRRLLDLCAAPGGKSTLWRSLMDEGALLVANEPVRQRAQVLAENLTKWGQPDVVCTSAYPEEFAPLGGFFDVVAADVPCSGEGMFRKDEGAVAEWSVAAVQACAARQWQIVESVWPALREGGYLVYSTCTYNPEENEQTVARVCRELGAELVPVETEAAWGVSGDTTGRGLAVYHFFPHRTRGEGLFLALLRKTASAPAPKEKKGRRARAERREPSVSGGAQVAGWLAAAERFKLFRPDDAHLAAVRRELADDVAQVCRTVRALTAGILLAEERGRKLVPQHALAVSVCRNEAAFPQAQLSETEALAYLRREAVTLAPGVPRGYVVVSYKGQALGFVNNLGARANNLYPQEWRIRH